jgi:hypothetical protein
MKSTSGCGRTGTAEAASARAAAAGTFSNSNVTTASDFATAASHSASA